MPVKTSDHQRRVAQCAVGPSTVRGQPGETVKRSRDFLAQVELGSVTETYGLWLERQTLAMQDAVLAGGRPMLWGFARKVLNIFMRDALYNHFLRSAYALDRFERQMQLPMDRHCAEGLRKRSGIVCPEWRTIRDLQEAEHSEWQRVAIHHAEQQGTYPVHLDVILWRPEPSK